VAAQPAKPFLVRIGWHTRSNKILLLPDGHFAGNEFIGPNAVTADQALLVCSCSRDVQLKSLRALHTKEWIKLVGALSLNGDSNVSLKIGFYVTERALLYGTDAGDDGTLVFGDLLPDKISAVRRSGLITVSVLF
jgi:hypothetical protein